MLAQAPFFQNYVKNVIVFDGHENHDAESRKKTPSARWSCNFLKCFGSGFVFGIAYFSPIIGKQ